MATERLHERIAAHFSPASERDDVWGAFDYLLDTDAFLNLGYSPWYCPHVVGSSQRRLATVVGEHLAAHCPTTEGVRLLAVGAGRGGPAIHLADRFGFRVTGVDLVPYNVSRARANAAEASVDATFCLADAARLPFAPDSLGAAAAIDALVYLPDRAAVFGALADTLEPGGVFVCTDLVARPDLDDGARRAVARFAEAWDMPFPGTGRGHARALADAGFRVHEVADISAHSVGRFRTWTALYDRLAHGPTGRLLAGLLRRSGLDSDRVTEQVVSAHEALPHLRHVLLVATRLP